MPILLGCIGFCISVKFSKLDRNSCMACKRSSVRSRLSPPVNSRVCRDADPFLMSTAPYVAPCG